MLWLWLSLLSALLSTALNLLMRVMAVKSSNTRVFSFVFNSYAAVLALILFLFEIPHIKFPQEIPLIQLLFIATTVILYGLYERLHFSIRKQIDASTLAILYRLSPVIAFLGSIFFFGESLTLTKLFATLLIVGASILVSYKHPHISLNRALLKTLIVPTILGIAWMLDKPASAHLPASLYGLILWTVPLIIIAFPNIPRTLLLKEIYTGGWKIGLMALLNVAVFYVLLKALALTDASKVIPVSSSSSVLIVLGGIFILNERSQLVKKLIAGVLVFWGVLLLR